jgi:hypothetical protein
MKSRIVSINGPSQSVLHLNVQISSINNIRTVVHYFYTATCDATIYLKEDVGNSVTTTP